MGINHRGSHITVPQQFLNGSNVVIGRKRVCDKKMGTETVNS